MRVRWVLLCPSDIAPLHKAPATAWSEVWCYTWGGYDSHCEHSYPGNEGQHALEKASLYTPHAALHLMSQDLTWCT